MKLFSSIIFILAIVGTQAKFNLRTYAQHKLNNKQVLQGAVNSGTHVVHDDVTTRVTELVDLCFKKVLGFENSALQTTKQVEDFQEQSAMDALNMCLQSQNLRLGHSQETSFGSKIGVAKAAADVLIAAENAFKADRDAIATNITNELQTLQDEAETTKNGIVDKIKVSGTETAVDAGKSIEKAAEAKESGLNEIKKEIVAMFSKFRDNTLEEKDLTETHVSAIASARAAFEQTLVNMTNEKQSLITSIVGHYNDALDTDCSDETEENKFSGSVETAGCEYFPHPVSGYPGQSCGMIRDADKVAEDANGDVGMPSAGKESAVPRMCGSGLACLVRDDGNAIIATKYQGNLEHSGYFVCVSDDDPNNPLSEVSNGLENGGIDCSGVTSAQSGTASTCNLYLLMKSD